MLTRLRKMHFSKNIRYFTRYIARDINIARDMNIPRDKNIARDMNMFDDVTTSQYPHRKMQRRLSN